MIIMTAADPANLSGTGGVISYECVAGLSRFGMGSREHECGVRESQPTAKWFVASLC